jgi:hypothetical protein
LKSLLRHPTHHDMVELGYCNDNSEKLLSLPRFKPTPV